MGVVFALYAIIFPMHRFLDLGLALAIAAAAYFLFNLVFKGQLVEVPKEISFERSGSAETNEMLAQGAAYVKRLSELGLSLRATVNDEKINRQIARLQEISIQIFDFVAKNPTHARKISTFMDYYYPTALKFLENYVDLSGKTTQGDNINTILDKIYESLDKIEEAFKHQLDNLYSDKVMDISTDIAVLDNIMKREGL